MGRGVKKQIVEKTETDMKPKVHVHQSVRELTDVVSEFIMSSAVKNIQQKGYFTFVLSGGKTPKSVYEKLAGNRIASSIQWKNVYVFWGDERYLPKDHPESNYRMANDAFLSKLPLPEENIFRVPAEITPVEKAARAYEEQLSRFFQMIMNKKRKKLSSPFPSFDLILLGLGRDGHTASLFPKDKALEEKKRWVVAVTAPDTYEVRERITITLPVINSTGCILLLVTGRNKRDALQTLLKEEPLNPDLFPAYSINPQDGFALHTDIPIDTNSLHRD